MDDDTPWATANLSKHLLIPSWTLFAIAVVLIAARVYNARAITGIIRIDLYFAMATFILACIGQAFFTISIFHGLGQPSDQLNYKQRTAALKWVWPDTTTVQLAQCTGKFAVVAFLRQMHGPDNRRKEAFLWTLVSSNLISNSICIAMIWTVCSPIEKLWDSHVPGTCLHIPRNQKMAFFQGSWSAAIDLVLAVYPTFFLYDIKIKRAYKAGLCILMGLGVIATACAIVKTVHLDAILKGSDSTVLLGQLMIWTCAEMWIILIVACVPPIRPLLVRCFCSMRTEITAKVKKHYPARNNMNSWTIRNSSPSWNIHSMPIFGGQRWYRFSEKRNGEGNESEEEILESKPPPDLGRAIVKTVNIEVEQCTRSSHMEAV